jgi:hypothetical protein
VLAAASPLVYGSVDELFFALVNLATQASGAGRRAASELPQ